VVAAARSILGDAREAECGPYRLLTDVGDSRILTLCSRLAEPLDEAYRRLYGLEPRGRPAEAIFLFAERSDFRRFSQEIAGLRSGYAGFADGLRGYAAFPAEPEDLDHFAQTLAHELSHLLNRRALGAGLPPWLSEGLADGIGDAATVLGLEEPKGLQGVRGQAQRLRYAFQGDSPPSLEGLVSLSRGQFDRGTVSYDYEQSALFVRFLLLSRHRQGFRRFLGDLASGTPYETQRLPAALELSWNELDREFHDWLLHTN
jgi:hypothetical protein